MDKDYGIRMCFSVILPGIRMHSSVWEALLWNILRLPFAAVLKFPSVYGRPGSVDMDILGCNLIGVHLNIIIINNIILISHMWAHSHLPIIPVPSKPSIEIFL